MKQSLKAGVTGVRKFTIDAGRTIDFMGDDCRVYATPELVRDIEVTCRDLMLEHAEAGEDSVGANVSIVHSAPTPLGMEVNITVSVAEVDRARVVFDISASDSVDTICTGKHERFAVPVDKIRQRILGKAEQAGSAG